jgi:hypothetical protein
VGSRSANGTVTDGSFGSRSVSGPDGSRGVTVLTVSTQVLIARIMASWLFRVAARNSSGRSLVGVLAMCIPPDYFHR